MRGIAEGTCCLASIQAGLTGPAGWEDTPSFHAFSSSTVPGVSSAAGIRGEDTREARGTPRDPSRVCRRQTSQSHCARGCRQPSSCGLRASTGVQGAGGVHLLVHVDYHPFPA